MTCFHCSKKISHKDMNNMIYIARSFGKTYNFHTDCFKEIAGDKYVPSSNKEILEETPMAKTLKSYNDYNDGIIKYFDAKERVEI